MQQIERYGVIALVFLLVTIVAVSFWGDSKSPGFWSRLTGKHDAKKDQVAQAPSTLEQQHLIDGQPPITPPGTPVPPAGGPMPPDGNLRSAVDMPPMPADPRLAGNNTPTQPPMTQPNPFGPGGQPPAIVTPQPVDPAPPASMTYVVQKGDSLASIARKRLGAESRWTEIQAANAGLEPKNLRVGQEILLPAGAKTLIAAEPKKTATPPAKPRTNAGESKKSPAVASKSGGTYKVKKGDGLRSIARTQLGDESRWKEIQAINPGLDANRLKVGESIKLPTAQEHHQSPGPVLASASVPSANDNKPRVR